MADSPQISIAVTQPRTVRFRLNLVQSLITWQLIHFKRTRSNGQNSSVT